MLLDEQAVSEARKTDMVTFLERYAGFAFLEKSGAFRCRQHPSLAVKRDRLSWYWHSKGTGGYGAVDYLMKIEYMAFREAVEVIGGYGFATPLLPQGRPTTTHNPNPPPTHKNLILPAKVGIPLRLFDYLCIKRGIDSGIIHKLIDTGQLYQDVRGNIVFVGFDEHGKAKFACLRGTAGDATFRRDCTGSDKRYSFNIANGSSQRLYIFESAIDAMSHATLANIEASDPTAWQRHNRISLAGTADTALPFFLHQHKAVKRLIFCLDNDPAGQEATVHFMGKYADKGYAVGNEPPMGKDFNDDLLDYIKTHPPKTQHRDDLSR